MDKMMSCVITAMMLLEMMGDFPDRPLSDEELANLAHSVLQVGFCGVHSMPKAIEFLAEIAENSGATIDEFIMNAPIAGSAE